MPREIIFNQEKVLEKAVDLFWEKGYAATSMEDLTQATGLNRSSIYNTFGSKLELYKKALNFYQKKASGLFHNALVKANNPLQAIENIFDSLISEIVSGDGARGCFNMNCKTEMSQKDASIKTWLEHTQQNSLDFFESLVKEGQEEGLINKDDSPAQYANYLYSAFQGMRMTGILITDKNVLTKIAEKTLMVLK